MTIDIEFELQRYKNYAEQIRPLVVETVSYLHSALREGKKVLVEGANAAMLDIDFGEPFIIILLNFIKIRCKITAF